jgi:hypothetical protein
MDYMKEMLDYPYLIPGVSVAARYRSSLRGQTDRVPRVAGARLQDAESGNAHWRLLCPRYAPVSATAE